MTVVRLEILSKEDVELVVQLAKRLHVEKIEISEDEFIGGNAMSPQELEAYLEDALTDKRISFEDFKKEMVEWK
ncbi:MAG TPA: hypothetical protein DCR35_07380 [Runella sp.]|nr:hypothetical protein [Runella sp.]HAO49125.1 hypothetical protein [Runella sp.]